MQTRTTNTGRSGWPGLTHHGPSPALSLGQVAKLPCVSVSSSVKWGSSQHLSHRAGGRPGIKRGTCLEQGVIYVGNRVTVRARGYETLKGS